MMPVLISCKTYTPANHFDPTTSTLKAVWDDQYTLRLAELEDQPGVYRFEACLREAYNHSPNQECVGALFTNESTDLLLSIDMIEAARLTPKQTKELKRVHQEFRAYDQAIQTQLNNNANSVLIGTGIVIGGEMIARKINAYGIPHSKQLKLVEADIADLNDRIIADQILMSHRHPDYERLKNLKNTLEYRALMTKADYLQQEFGSATLSEVNKKLNTYEIQLKEAGFNTAKIPQPLAAKYFNHVTPALIHDLPKNFNKYPTIISQEFINFYLHQIPETVINRDEHFWALHNLLHQGTVFDIDKYFKLWLDQGYTILELFHRPFRSQLDKFFKFNQFEAMINPQAAGHGLYHLTAVKNALLQGDSRVLQAIQQYSHHLGVSPSALARIKWVQRYRAQIPLNTEALLALEKGELKPRIMDQQTAEALQQVKNKLAPAEQSLSLSQRKINELTHLKSVANDLTQRLGFAAHFMLGITVSRMVAAGVAISGVVGLGLHIIGRNHSVSTDQLAAATPIIERYNNLQVLINQNDSLLNTDDTSSTQVPDVADILAGLAIWQNTIWVDTQDTNVVVTAICLPQRIYPNSTYIASHCKPVTL